MALNFDPNLVPYPPYEFRLATGKRNNHGMNKFGRRKLRGISWHRGITGNQTLDGAVGYLIAPSTAGLTDGYIDNNTGRVVIMNPMTELFPDVLNIKRDWVDMAGWANGPYNAGAASADGRAFRNRFGGSLGANIVNQDLESYEILGNYNTPVSDKAKRVIAQIAANRAQRSKIPWDRWPINPATGITEMFGHREFCGVSYKECPGSVVWSFINGPLIGMVRDILKQAQVDGKRVAVDGANVEPIAPKPSTPRKFELRFDTYIRTSPGFWDYDNNRTNVIKLLDEGTTGTVISGPKNVDGVDFYDLKIEGFGTGWVQDQVLHTLHISESK